MTFPTTIKQEQVWLVLNLPSGASTGNSLQVGPLTHFASVREERRVEFRIGEWVFIQLKAAARPTCHIFPRLSPLIGELYAVDFPSLVTPTIAPLSRLLGATLFDSPVFAFDDRGLCKSYVPFAAQ